MAKKQATGGGGGGGLDALAGGGMEDIQKLLADAMNNPEAMETIKQYGQQFGSVLDQMMKMSPEELQNQMAEAMKIMTQGDIVESVLNQKESVLQALKASGTVTADELAKYEADPQYFELKMRESFDTMKDMFANPEYISKAADAVKSIKTLMDDPNKLTDMLKDGFGSDWTSDEKIEEARLQFLRGDYNTIPYIKELFSTDEMQDVLRDPEQWKELVKDGVDSLFNLGTPTTGPTTTTTIGSNAKEEL